MLTYIVAGTKARQISRKHHREKHESL